MTDLSKVSTNDLIQAIADRCSAMSFTRIEKGQPAFAAGGSPYIVAGLLHGATIINDQALLQEVKEFDEKKPQKPHLVLAQQTIDPRDLDPQGGKG